jgi:hypothetical protein
MLNNTFLAILLAVLIVFIVLWLVIYLVWGVQHGRGLG